MERQAYILTHKDTKTKIRISKDSLCFYVDGKVAHFSKLQYSILLCEIAHHSPNGVDYDQIKSVLSMPQNSNNDIHKKVHDAKREIKKLLPNAEIIKNITSFGYRLSEEWHSESASEIDDVISSNIASIASITERCIEYMHNRTIKSTCAGIMYLDFDHDFATQNFIIVDRAMWSIIDLLSSDSNLAETVDLKSVFAEFLSYVIYWRVGDNLTEEKWRGDYEREIRNHLRKIKDLVVRMQ